MARGGYGLSKVSIGPAITYRSMPCGQGKRPAAVFHPLDNPRRPPWPNTITIRLHAGDVSLVLTRFILWVFLVVGMSFHDLLKCDKFGTEIVRSR
jgi:hypothetical protein